MHVADVAARFAQHRKGDPEAIAAAFYAGALHGIGAVRVVVPRDASDRAATIAHWDEPPAGAAIIAAIGIFPTATADAIRWHRESFDGTGFPDRLRWNGIPETAMMVNIARTFVGALEEQATRGGSAGDAVFTLVDASGRIFSLATMAEFRAFLAASPDSFDAAYEPDWALRDIDPFALVADVCAQIDARQPRTAGRGDRLEPIVRAIVAQHAGSPIDAERAVYAARLTALARIGGAGNTDEIFSLSRLGLESRAAQAQSAARILQTAPSFAPFADTVGATQEWYDGSGLPDKLAGSAIDPLARILAVALAAEAVVAGNAEQRIEAAAKTRLDPAVVAAYLAARIPR